MIDLTIHEEHWRDPSNGQGDGKSCIPTLAAAEEPHPDPREDQETD